MHYFCGRFKLFVFNKESVLGNLSLIEAGTINQLSLSNLRLDPRYTIYV